ncbi:MULTISPECIES: HesB/YadR/YfhF family protein [Staphylococcus]|uniref:HesB/YadR/YfhF family protein n=1 Tax=Staphylococcus TaxID=1279 RepID=UPI00024E42AC|nr:MULTISPECIES: hypothetical protein [Staphylococcus]SLE29948.1 Iron-sulphur cluster biosynthesis [Mycobacteroides abscessus subsp. massiliense]EHS01760.1 HesB-like protein [Staphylococcus epidermidis VCU129]EJE06895.1 hypothetical protein HMPREF9984_01905 [Staphylococcus epidermidis NIHLM037]EJE18209.1 hypothetical protein HMPREF9978_03837 [Staphylococcus epidermidis NIHLM015]MBC2997651.1 hypothetical protein [Staphylococcus epidermidis]
MNINLTQKAVEWFKNELDLPINNKVLQFYVRYGGEFQLKQGFSSAFTVEDKDAIEIGFEQTFFEINVVIAEKDLWYFQGETLTVDAINHEDEIIYKRN